MAALTALSVTGIAKREKEVGQVEDPPGTFTPIMADMPEDLGVVTVLYTNGTTNPTIKFPVDTIRMSPSMVCLELYIIGFKLDGNRSPAQESQDIQDYLLALIAEL